MFGIPSIPKSNKYSEYYYDERGKFIQITIALNVINFVFANDRFTMADNNKIWSEDETMALLDIWGGKEMQEKMGITKRNRLLWEDISNIMIRRGFNRSYKQCGGKIHNMKVEYRKIKLHKKLNNFKYYDAMDTIMTKNPIANIDNSSENCLKRESDDYDNESLDFFLEDDHESLSEINDEPSTSGPVDRANTGINQTNDVTFITERTIDTPRNQGKNTPSSPRPMISDGRKRPRIEIDYDLTDNLSMMFDKIREIQKESDERFYAWEEKRLRIEREFEERRQQRELEREKRRDEYFLKFAMALIGQYFKTDTGVTGSSTSNEDTDQSSYNNLFMNFFNKNTHEKNAK